MMRLKKIYNAVRGMIWEPTVKLSMNWDCGGKIYVFEIYGFSRQDIVDEIMSDIPKYWRLLVRLSPWSMGINSDISMFKSYTRLLHNWLVRSVNIDLLDEILKRLVVDKY